MARPRAAGGRSDLRAAWAIAVDYAVALGAIALAVRLRSPLATVAAWIVVASRQVALLNLVHASAHKTLFATHGVRLDWLIGYPILDSAASYAPNHLDHHREIAGGDDDRFAYLHGELGLPGRGPWSRTWVVFVRPLLGHSAYTMLRDSLPAWRRQRAFALRLALFWALVAAAAALLHLGTVVLVYWVLPLVWLHPVLNMWAEISDHFGARGRPEARNMRGFLFCALLKAHDNYHCVHHINAGIPFYRYREAYRRLVAEGHLMHWVDGFRGFFAIVYARAE